MDRRDAEKLADGIWDLYDDANSAIEELQARIRELEGIVEDLKEEARGLDSTINDLETENAKLRGDLETMMADEAAKEE